jgi:hypothetical protein
MSNIPKISVRRNSTTKVMLYIQIFNPVMNTVQKTFFLQLSAMTLNYELEEELPKGGLGADAKLSLPSAPSRGTW